MGIRSIGGKKEERGGKGVWGSNTNATPCSPTTAGTLCPPSLALHPLPAPGPNPGRDLAQPLAPSARSRAKARLAFSSGATCGKRSSAIALLPLWSRLSLPVPGSWLTHHGWGGRRGLGPRHGRGAMRQSRSRGGYELHPTASALPGAASAQP